MRLHHLLVLLVLPLLLLSCAPIEEPISVPGANIAARLKPAAPRQEVPKSLRDRVEAALQQVHQRELLTTHAFWTIFHGMLGNGLETPLLDPKTGQTFKAIDYICEDRPMRGLQFIPTADGLDVRIGPTFDGQGHQDQFVSEAIERGIDLNKKFRVGGKDYVFWDFIHHSKARARVTGDQELSWTLVVLGVYGTKQKWTNMFGEELTYEDMVHYELHQPIETAACGGTHRLFGLTWAYHLHRKEGGQDTGVWLELLNKQKHYQELARKYQNSDGSFSTEYLAGRGHRGDLDRRIGTTGHVLEWLAFSLPDEELTKPWMQEAASALSVLILEGQGRLLDGGSIYHAAHGLHIYHTRVFGPSQPGYTPPPFPLPPR